MDKVLDWTAVLILIITTIAVASACGYLLINFREARIVTGSVIIGVLVAWAIHRWDNI